MGLGLCNRNGRCYSKVVGVEDGDGEVDVPPSSGICRPLSEILKELNKKVPDSLVKTRLEKDGFPIRYIPWHIVNRILNLHAPGTYTVYLSIYHYVIVFLIFQFMLPSMLMLEWSGEVRNITYSPDARSVSVVYRVTLYATDAEVGTYHFILNLCIKSNIRSSTLV